MKSALMAWAVGVAALLPLAAHAADPSDPLAPVPPPPHHSSLQRYRAAGPLDTPPADWRDSNRRVQAAGGWRALARETAASGAAPAASSPSPHQHKH